MSSKEKTPMSEEKRKRIVVAMTAAGVLLIIFLVIILIVQFVQIGVRNSKAEEYKKMAEEYKQLQTSTEKDINFYQTERGLYILALQNGWITPKN